MTWPERAVMASMIVGGALWFGCAVGFRSEWVQDRRRRLDFTTRQREADGCKVNITALIRWTLATRGRAALIGLVYVAFWLWLFALFAGISRSAR